MLLAPEGSAVPADAGWTEVIVMADSGPTPGRARPVGPPAGALAGGRADVLDQGSGAWVVDLPAAVTYSRLEDACAGEYPRLVRLLTLYCGDRDIASDLAQEACARGCAHWSAVSRMSDQRAWFTRVALNLARSRWRRQVVERRVVALLGARRTAVVEVDVAQSVTVEAAIASLTPRQRAAVFLRYFEDLDVAATAAIMRCSQGTVKKLTARGVAGLRAVLEFDDATSGGDDD